MNILWALADFLLWVSRRARSPKTETLADWFLDNSIALRAIVSPHDCMAGTGWAEHSKTGDR